MFPRPGEKIYFLLKISIFMNFMKLLVIPWNFTILGEISCFLVFWGIKSAFPPRGTETSIFPKEFHRYLGVPHGPKVQNHGEIMEYHDFSESLWFSWFPTISAKKYDFHGNMHFGAKVDLPNLWNSLGIIDVSAAGRENVLFCCNFSIFHEFHEI